jgi:hypothetical protein
VYPKIVNLQAVKHEWLLFLKRSDRLRSRDGTVKLTHDVEADESASQDRNNLLENEQDMTMLRKI